MAAFFRLVQDQWAHSAFTGEGARRFGGRWNHVGSPAVYLASSRSLAALEIIVHAPRDALLMPWRMIEVDVPDAWIDIPTKLPKDWRRQPSADEARDFGSRWLAASANFALRVPSAIIPQEHALLANPGHPHLRKLKGHSPEPFQFDPHLAG